MIKVDNRESAHVRSRVKDLSVVPNVPSFNALLACITPISKLQKTNNLYEPVLIRDNDTLISTFGDPRIDPEKYIDLYTIMQVIGNGGTCYVAKVDSGSTGVYQFPFVADKQIDKADVVNFVLDETDDTNHTWKAENLANKYVILNVVGTTDDDTESVTVVSSDIPMMSEDNEGSDNNQSDEDNPFENAQNYSAQYTYTVAADESNPGKYKITLVFNKDIVNPPTAIKVELDIDPTWGFEEITLEPKEAGDTTKYHLHLATGGLSKQYVLNNIVYKDPDEPTDEGTSVLDKVKSVNWVQLASGLWDVEVEFVSALDNEYDVLNVTSATQYSHALVAYSSMSDNLTFECTLSKSKPYSINQYYLHVTVKTNNGANELASAKIKIDDKTTTNQSIVNALNSTLGAIARFELLDPDTASACGVNNNRGNSIACIILDTYAYNNSAPNPNPCHVEPVVTVSTPDFKVSIYDYINALEQYKDRKYVGCLMADMVAPVNSYKDEQTSNIEVYDQLKRQNGTGSNGNVVEPSGDDRRTLHFYLKEIACERKNTTVVLSTPYYNIPFDYTSMQIDEACDWVSSSGTYNYLWEYGQTGTTDYSLQSFYLEMYYSWLNMQCTWIVNGSAKSKQVRVAPSNVVINNILTSYRNRGVQYPVAGDQGGTLPETCTILINPKTKAERDQLVQYRINPIWDTGTRGIQIYGNESLNAGYTDLNAAHIARLLVYIRGLIDDYTETLKFSINSLTLWDRWKGYVTSQILEPLIAVNALSEYRVAMGEDTTSREEIANRMIRGKVSLIFYQSAEVYDLEYTVFSSATTIDEAMQNI